MRDGGRRRRRTSAGAGGGRKRRRSSAAPTALLVAVLLAWPVAGCGGGAAEEEEKDPPPELAIFVYDRSGSMPDYQLERAQDLTADRVRDLDHGDRIVAMELLEASLDEPPRRWSQRVPEREYPDMDVGSDSVARTRFLRDARVYLRNFTDPDAREPSRGTDILSTLHDVAADLRAHEDHRATLYLFSDMLQANRELNFERAGVEPPTSWVEEAASEDRLPDLRGLCVVVVGARTETEKGQAVKEFWRRYFEATGAIFSDRTYTLRPVELPTCQGR